MTDFSRFHAKDGWYFQRHADGAVELTIEGDANAETDMALSNTFDPATWASIVAFVSAGRDNAETFAEAQRLHDGTATTLYAGSGSDVSVTVRVVLDGGAEGK